MLNAQSWCCLHSRLITHTTKHLQFFGTDPWLRDPSQHTGQHNTNKCPCSGTRTHDPWYSGSRPIPTLYHTATLISTADTSSSLITVITDYVTNYKLVTFRFQRPPFSPPSLLHPNPNMTSKYKTISFMLKNVSFTPILITPCLNITLTPHDSSQHFSNWIFFLPLPHIRRTNSAEWRHNSRLWGTLTCVGAVSCRHNQILLVFVLPVTCWTRSNYLRVLYVYMPVRKAWWHKYNTGLGSAILFVAFVMLQS